VCLGPGVLVVSFLHQAVRNDLNESYHMFANTLTRAISDLGAGGLGIALDVGHVTRAYCDGRFDLAWQGLKVGGMAQRRRAVEGGVSVWIHAVLSIETLAEPYPAEVARLYADLGSPRVADPACTTSLARCFGPGGAPAD
jgi:lipoate-protein ligase A